MNAGTIVELILGLPTLLGGGGVLVAKLTRIAVAVETLVEASKKAAETFADHEKRLARGGL